ncbi:MAG TPA: RNA methyltransferase [Gammaproteobacteria bacterium]|nr:RNA methyltransferase [Gammaproteobacteria bacterium]
MEEKFSNIHIVMVGTTHPGNIGGVARAMKNMGLSRLSLVAPEAPFPHAKARARASGAVNVLENTQVFATLEEAIADCSLVVGASARMRTLPWPVVDPRECASRVANVDKKEEVAIVLGRENSGLTNEELELCQLLVTIPTNPDFSSLNIAAAAQVLCYEIHLAMMGTDKIPEDEPDSPLATSAEREGMFKHFEEALTELEFLKPDNPGQLMRRLRRLFTRTGLERLEVNILRGIMTAAQKAKSHFD